MARPTNRARWTGLLLAGALGLAAFIAVVASESRRATGALGGGTRSRLPSSLPAGPKVAAEPASRAEVPAPVPEVLSAMGTGAADGPTAFVATEGSDPEGSPKEGAFHARFLELARTSPEALADCAADVLDADGPDPEKVALLRALSDCGSPRTSEFLLLAVEHLPDVATPGHESVPSFALRALVGRAAGEPAARLALERLSWESPAHLVPEFRRRSVAALCALAAPEEAARIAGRLAGETDASVRASGIEALCANPRAEAADVLVLLGLEPVPPSAPPAVEE